MASPDSRSLRDRLFAPVDIASLVLFRLGFGAIMLWEVWRYLADGRVSRYYIRPEFHFKYFGFEWVQAWGGNEMTWHFYGLGALAVCIMAGLFYRAAAALFFLGFTYVFLLDQARYLNHFYLVSLISFLIIFVPAHRAFSLDALMRPRLRSSTAPAWSLWMLRAQIGIVYFFGGVAKLSSDWLQGEPMRMWLADRTDFPLLGQYFTQEWMVYSFAYGGMLLDLFVVPLLLWKPTRWLAILLSTAFHLMNARLFDIGIFPWFMLCSTLLFLEPDFPRRTWGALKQMVTKSSGWRPAVDLGGARPAGSGGWSVGQRTAATFLVMYFTVQVLMPLRHFVYPGDANWTEEGHRFAWHMKLRSKDGEVRYKVVQPSTGRFWDFDPEGYVDKKQLEEMSTRPDMIQQFAKYLAQAMKRKGYGDVQVHALATASLNGREEQQLIDPTADLAKEKRTLLPAAWIVPLSTPLKGAQDEGEYHHAALVVQE